MRKTAPILTPAGRLRYRSLSVPTAHPDYPQTVTYSAVVLFKDDQTTQGIVKTLDDFGAKCFGEDYVKMSKPYVRGEDLVKQKLKEKKELSDSFVESMQGVWQFKFSSNPDHPPTIYLSDKRELKRGTPELNTIIDDTFYEGCIVRVATIGVEYVKNAKVFGITLPIAGIQFVTDGARFGAVDTNKMFSTDFDTSGLDAFQVVEADNTGLVEIDDVNI